MKAFSLDTLSNHVRSWMGLVVPSGHALRQSDKPAIVGKGRQMFKCLKMERTPTFLARVVNIEKYSK